MPSYSHGQKRMYQVTKRTPAMVKHATKAAKRAKHLRLSLNKMLRDAPDAGSVNELVQNVRMIELRLDTMLAIIEEVLHRDPVACARELLSGEPFDSLSEIEGATPTGDEYGSLYCLPRTGHPRYRT